MGGFKYFAFAVLAFVLAGCETLDLGGYIPQREATARDGMGQSVTTPNASRPRRQVEPDYIPDTDELIGADAVALEGFLGAPSLRRAEQASEVWQYATDACVLFVFLYPNEAGEARVSYLTSSGVHQDQQTPGDQQCVEAVARMAANAVPVS